MTVCCLFGLLHTIDQIFFTVGVLLTDDSVLSILSIAYNGSDIFHCRCSVGILTEKQDCIKWIFQLQSMKAVKWLPLFVQYFLASCYDKMEKLEKGKPLILLLLGVPELTSYALTILLKPLFLLLLRVLELTSHALTILLYLSQVTVSVPRNTLSLLMWQKNKDGENGQHCIWM